MSEPVAARNRHAIDEERRRIVEQAFTLQDGHDPVRGTELVEDGAGGGGIRRRHDGAERDGGGERKPGDLPADDCHCRGGKENRDNHQRSERQRIALEIARRSVECRIEQDRCDEKGQGEFGIDRDFGGEGEKGEAGARQGKEGGVGHLEPPGEAGEQHGGEEQR